MVVFKLKHIALKEIHYQLLNTCLIIATEGKDYCFCWKYSGCRRRPSFTHLIGVRNYCMICQLIQIYSPHRVERLRTIQETWKLYLELKKDLQEYVRCSKGVKRYPCFWNKNYTDKFKLYKSHLVKKINTKEYMQECYNYLSWLNP